MTHPHQPRKSTDVIDKAQQRARAAAFLSGWIQDNNFRLDAPNSAHDDERFGDGIASRLPWTDPLTGTTGQYTGQINNQRHPHGYGALVYESMWMNGVPVQPWSPGDEGGRPWARPDEERRTRMRSAPPPKNKTHVRTLDLGDVGTPPYMLPSDSGHSLDTIDLLQTHDFAFVLRSDGRWTYAILADRRKRSLLFVVNTEGDRKKLRKKDWATSVRLVNPEEARHPGMRRRRAGGRKESRGRSQGMGRKKSEKVEHGTRAA